MVTLVVAVALVAGARRDGSPPAATVAADRPEAATASEPVLDAVPTTGAAPTTPPPAPATSTVVTHPSASSQAAPAPTTPPALTTRAPAPATPVGEAVTPGTYHELPDTGNYIVIGGTPGGAEGSGTTEGNGPERLRFAVSVGGGDDGGTVGARLVNVSGRTMRFPGGVHVTAEITKDGHPWRTFDLVDGAITELAPGQEASVGTSFAFDGPGQYSAWGSTDIQLV